MKTGIIGLPQSGKATVFDALTGSVSDTTIKSEPRLGTIHVPDPRVDRLSAMYNPKKTSYAQVEYFLPSYTGGQKESLQAALNQVRDTDALAQVVRNFTLYGLGDPDPRSDFLALDQELIIADQVVVEKRLERIEADNRRGKKSSTEEFDLLKECLNYLEAETPLRRIPHLADHALLRGFAFLSAKPKLILFNNDDDNDQAPDLGNLAENEESLVIRAKLERELAQMSEDESLEFLEEFGITASALDRVIKQTYSILGLVSFFTVGEDEVKAWTVTRGAEALDAAGTIHSDIKKGFIRAEVVSYDDLMKTGHLNEAKKQGLLRLEGKTYLIQDGDIVHFRFNV